MYNMLGTRDVNNIPWGLHHANNSNATHVHNGYVLRELSDSPNPRTLNKSSIFRTTNNALTIVHVHLKISH